MTLVSGRGYISPNIAHMGNVRAHSTLHSRLNTVIPAIHRRPLQPLVRSILDDKSRPATLAEAITSRRNNARSADAAKRRGLNSSATDKKTLKYSAVNRPARFATPERRHCNPPPLRFNHAFLLLPH
jgi:hypothetical protein